MDVTRLTRQSHRRERAGPVLLGQFTLSGARAHELCGPARRRLALWLARESHGPILWIRTDWHPDRLHMAGVRAEIDPGRLTFVEARKGEDMLWCAEEALRSGAVPLVVADLPEPPGLTPVRRLHLAADVGAAAGETMPVMALVTPGEGGAAGVESRWHLAPEHGLDRDGWRLRRLRARAAPPADWRVERQNGGLTVVAENSVELA